MTIRLNGEDREVGEVLVRKIREKGQGAVPGAGAEHEIDQAQQLLSRQRFVHRTPPPGISRPAVTVGRAGAAPGSPLCPLGAAVALRPPSPQHSAFS